MANVNEGLDEMAKDLSGSPQTQDVSQAMSEHDLEETAEELRKLAEELNPEDQQAMQALREALQQASENSNPSMQKLANDMKQAADSLGNKNSKAAQDALNQAAKDTQNLRWDRPRKASRVKPVSNRKPAARQPASSPGVPANRREPGKRASRANPETTLRPAAPEAARILPEPSRPRWRSWAHPQN
jgi:hypothetical protein